MEKQFADQEPSLNDVANLIDLVAGQRSDLLPTLWDSLQEAEVTRRHAKTLAELIEYCGLDEDDHPCGRAIAIWSDLEHLMKSSSSWSHPAQVVVKPKAQALKRLCTARIEEGDDFVKERLQQILPRLEKAAALEEKAASRRQARATSSSNWVRRRARLRHRVT